MESKYVIDSSVLIAFYYEGDTNHNIAVQVLKRIQAENLIIHPYIIQEVATVLAYKLSKKTANDFVSNVLNANNVDIPLVDIKSEGDSFVLEKKKVSFTDTTIVSLAKRLNANLITFDKQMASIFKS